jgi:beta-lactamase superfamily II metal-dependent hydrolase
MLTDPPEANQLEVSVFSRGYGESIVVHVGGGRWVIIDSLLTSDRLPVAAVYLDALGIDLAQSVDAILLTHWHDDHVAGATQLVSRAPSAVVALSSCLQKDEFKALLRSRGAPEAGSYGGGMSELLGVLRAMSSRPGPRKWCTADKLIAADRVNDSYRFEALSPSEADFEAFVIGLAEWDLSDARIQAPHRNDASVASVVQVQDHILLFGADLETGTSGTGWHAVHSTVWQARGRASFFKIPHHGSSNADFPAVWADMVTENVMAALTPWNRGRKLPTQADVDRIVGHTVNAHAAARPLSSRSLSRLNAVEKSLRQAKMRLVTPADDLGHLRIRMTNAGWVSEYANQVSCPLSDSLAA